MDSQFSKDLMEFDSTFEKLLEVEDGFIKKMKYRKCVKEAKNFYRAYVKKCNEYNEYIDFFTPLLYHLIACGFGYDKSAEYLSEIRVKILKYLNETIPNDVKKNFSEEFRNIG